MDPSLQRCFKQEFYHLILTWPWWRLTLEDRNVRIATINSSYFLPYKHEQEWQNLALKMHVVFFIRCFSCVILPAYISSLHKVGGWHWPAVKYWYDFCNIYRIMESWSWLKSPSAIIKYNENKYHPCFVEKQTKAQICSLTYHDQQGPGIEADSHSFCPKHETKFLSIHLRQTRYHYQECPCCISRVRRAVQSSA